MSVTPSSRWNDADDRHHQFDLTWTSAAHTARDMLSIGLLICIHIQIYLVCRVYLQQFCHFNVITNRQISGNLQNNTKVNNQTIFACPSVASIESMTRRQSICGAHTHIRKLTNCWCLPVLRLSQCPANRIHHLVICTMHGHWHTHILPF